MDKRTVRRSSFVSPHSLSVLYSVSEYRLRMSLETDSLPEIYFSAPGCE